MPWILSRSTISKLQVCKDFLILISLSPSSFFLKLKLFHTHFIIMWNTKVTRNNTKEKQTLSISSLRFSLSACRAQWDCAESERHKVQKLLPWDFQVETLCCPVLPALWASRWHPQYELCKCSCRKNLVVIKICPLFFLLFPENYREGDSQQTDKTLTERRGRILSDAFTIWCFQTVISMAGAKLRLVLQGNLFPLLWKTELPSPAQLLMRHFMFII